MGCSFFSFVGSLEEQWYLEILDKGSVSCPTCQAVGRKTIEGLKKHMETCKQVRDFVAFCDGCDLFPYLRHLSPSGILITQEKKQHCVIRKKHKLLSLTDLGLNLHSATHCPLAFQVWALVFSFKKRERKGTLVAQWFSIALPRA